MADTIMNNQNLMKLYDAVHWPRLTVGQIELIARAIRELNSYSDLLIRIASFINGLSKSDRPEAEYAGFLIGVQCKSIANKSGVEIGPLPFPASVYYGDLRRVYLAFGAGYSGLMHNAIESFIEESITDLRKTIGLAIDYTSIHEVEEWRKLDTGVKSPLEKLAVYQSNVKPQSKLDDAVLQAVLHTTIMDKELTTLLRSGRKSKRKIRKSPLREALESTGMIVKEYTSVDEQEHEAHVQRLAQKLSQLPQR